jgi:hypothetical protein
VSTSMQCPLGQFSGTKVMFVSEPHIVNVNPVVEIYAKFCIMIEAINHK